MMELPEAATVARQLNAELRGQRVAGVHPGKTPHKFAFFSGDAAEYDGRMRGRTMTDARHMGGFVRLALGDGMMLLLGDGVVVRYLAPGQEYTGKYQLWLDFEGGAALVCSVQMYGGMWAVDPAAYDNPYYHAALEKPDPLTDAFDAAWFEGLLHGAKKSLSAKALLATEQRIPGLGNGMLQDVLFAGRVHPKSRLENLCDGELEALFAQTRGLLRAAAAKGGRDTEKDIYGAPGGYNTVLCAKTAKAPCPVCGGAITKQAYLGGSVYVCPTCQPQK